MSGGGTSNGTGRLTAVLLRSSNGIIVKVGDWSIIGRACLLAILGALARSSGCFVGVWVESVLWWDGSL